MIKEKFLEDKIYSIETRFGVLEYSSKNTYWFKDGILGFSDCKYFALSSFPLPNVDDKFMLLQSLENLDIGFILMNTVISDQPDQNTLIFYEDLEGLLRINKIDISKVSVHVVASVCKQNDQSLVAVNLKAPILLNPFTMEGWQLVLTDTKYHLRCLLD
jgi:flagellar assembly factor FliW